MKYAVIFLLCLALISAVFLLPTGYVVVSEGEFISVTQVLQPQLPNANIFIPTVYVYTQKNHQIKANTLNALVATMHPQQTLTLHEDFLSQEQDVQRILSQEEFAADIIPFIVALNKHNQPFWLRGEGVIALADHQLTGLKRNDLILGANGKAIYTLNELLQREYLDEQLTLVVLREEQQLVIADADITNAPLTTYNPTLHTNIAVNLQAQRAYVGRSADLAIALYMHELITAEHTTCNVAATGTLQPDGTINEVLEIETKIRTASNHQANYIIIPRANNHQETHEIPVYRASTYQEAINILQEQECE